MTRPFEPTWADCRRLLPTGWDLSLVVRASGQTLALATNGTTRRWADGETEAAALEGLRDRLLEDLEAVP